MLVVGDSSAAWNLSRPALEQVSGRKVGLVAYESAMPTGDFALLTEALAERYLKPDGVLVLSFADWVWRSKPAEGQRTPELRKLCETAAKGAGPLQRR